MEIRAFPVAEFRFYRLADGRAPAGRELPYYLVPGRIPDPKPWRLIRGLVAGPANALLLLPARSAVSGATPTSRCPDRRAKRLHRPTVFYRRRGRSPFFAISITSSPSLRSARRRTSADRFGAHWLGLGGREQYIRDGLKLDPKMVEWALEGLQATRPDVAVGFADAVQLGHAKHAGPGRGHKTDSNTTRFGRDAAYIQARLKRDGHTELLAKIDNGELSANAAAVELGWRSRMVQHPATVEGFARAIERSLSEREQEGSWCG